MKKNPNILDCLRPATRDTREFRALAEAENPELKAIWDALDSVFNNHFVMDADEYGVKRWEKILEIFPSSSATLEDRKFTILNRLNETLPYTMKMLKRKLNSMLGESNYIARYINDTYTLFIRVRTESENQYQEAFKTIEKMIPCNLVLDYGKML